jgi:hypothetical protein
MAYIKKIKEKKSSTYNKDVGSSQSISFQREAEVPSNFFLWHSSQHVNVFLVERVANKALPEKKKTVQRKKN